MQVIHSPEEMRRFAREVRRTGRTLALVPTMGALHEGHLSLVRKAKQQCDATIVSIFVNPTQFGPSEDFDRYPRDLKKDLDILRSFNVDAAFAPSVEEMYPKGFAAAVDPGAAATTLEGCSRPGHFRGVATVVLKLFNITTPDMAYFGQKDFQQAVVIEHMICDLNLDVRVVICPTVRGADGVAASSRNAFLNSEQRISARRLNQSLNRARELVWQGETRPALVMEEMRRVFSPDARISLDYVAIVDRDSLAPVERITSGCVALVAARVGTARLIDNAILGPFGTSEEELLQPARPSIAQRGGAVHPPGLETESLRQAIQQCRDCAAVSTVVLPPREFLAKYIKSDYVDLNAIRVLVIGRDGPWNPGNYLYRKPASQDRFVTRLYELLGVSDFSEFKSAHALTDALRCHAIISPVPEKALANCARHLRQELLLFPSLEAIVVLGEDAYHQFQRFILGRAVAEIRPWSQLLGEEGWASEDVTLEGRNPARVFYCYHPVSAYRQSPSIAHLIAPGNSGRGS